MATYESKKVSEIIDWIEDDPPKIVLPAIQRDFVWKHNRIIDLFDSILRDYPIGTFLFWKLKKADVKDNRLKLREFRRDNKEESEIIMHYGDRDRIPSDITGVVDGQQRLTSLYIGLRGSFYVKNKTLEEKKLYLNLANLPYEEVYGYRGSTTVLDKKRKFDFKFISPNQVNEDKSKNFWYEVGDIMGSKDPNFDIEDYVDSIVRKASVKSDLNKKYIRKAIGKLREQIRNHDIIYYTCRENDSLNTILDIFVKVNSRGITLAKIDLLFSTLVANWQEGYKTIKEYLPELNKIGGFSFKTDFVMLGCLVLSECKVALKVGEFDSEKVNKIKDTWKKISSALLEAAKLVANSGFRGPIVRNISQTAILPIAYHYMRNESVDKQDEENMKRYLMSAVAKGVYGNNSDKVLDEFREALRGEYKEGRMVFPIEKLLKLSLASKIKLSVSTDQDIDYLLDNGYPTASFPVLALLYPNLRYEEVHFHQDHIHPRARFGQNWKDKVHKVPNLQILKGDRNEEKGKMPFKEWMDKEHKDSAKRKSYCESNYIPDESLWDFDRFEEFYDERRKLMKKELMRILRVSHKQSREAHSKAA